MAKSKSFDRRNQALREIQYRFPFLAVRRARWHTDYRMALLGHEDLSLSRALTNMTNGTGVSERWS